MIRIGLTCGFLYPDSSRAAYSAKTLSFVENETVAYLASSGAMPVIIPDLPESQLAPILAQLDAVVLHGGADVAPESYGEKPIGPWIGDRHRDEYELRIIDYAFKARKPILGICRGCQLLNVYFGGTLYQDIPTQHPSPVAHQNAELFDHCYHPIELAGNSFMQQLYAHDGVLRVNSIHHQAVKRLGDNLTPLAISPTDGLVEAFYYTGPAQGFYLGVQWHPEFYGTASEPMLDAGKLLLHFVSQLSTPKK